MGFGRMLRFLFFAMLWCVFLSSYANASDICVCNDKAHCGMPCESDFECCSGLCSNGECSLCYEIGQSCSQRPTDCCPGLECKNGSCKDPTHDDQSWHSGLFILIALAALISSLFLIVAYMFSKILEIQVLEAWVKIEFGELAKAILIAVFCIALIQTANSAAQFLSGEPAQTNVISAAKDFLYGFYSDGQALYMRLAVAYFNIAKVASYSYTAGTSPGGMFTISYTQAPATGLSPLVGEVGQALDATANFMLLNASQAAFLDFFGAAAAVFLPVGIFLRSFSFTRRLGGTLLAATIAASVIYPASILLSKEIYSVFSPQLKDSIQKIKVADAQNPPSSEVVCNPAMQYFVQSPLPFLGGEIGWWVVGCFPPCIASSILTAGASLWACLKSCYDLVSYVFQIIKAMFPVIIWTNVFSVITTNSNAGKLIEDFYMPMQEYAIPAIAQFSVISLILFLIPLIITLSALRSFAIAFGGEAFIYGLSKLV